MEIIIDCLKDTFIILPTIFIIYLLLEWIEKQGWTLNRLKNLNVIAGGIIGLLPECGTGIMASKLYSQSVITVGTLLAIFISSSDEAIIILLTGSQFSLEIFKLLGIKLLFGILLGLVVDAFIPSFNQTHQVEPLEHHCHHIVRHALKHTLQIISFVFVSQLIISAIIAFIGEDVLISFLNTHRMIQPIIAGLIGLIPNCAGSMILAQVYLNGMLSFGALFAGLSCSTGLGLLTLYRYLPNKKTCFMITILIYVSSILLGYILL